MKIFENYKFWYSFYFKLDKLFECEFPWKLFAETVLHILKSQFSAFWKQLSKKITHICRRWGTPQNFLSAFNDELWKTEKSEFWKNEKNPQPYEVQFLRYGVRQNIFVILGRFLPFYHPPPPSPPTANNAENQNLEKNGKIIWRCHHFKLVQQKKWCVLTQIQSVTEIIFCHFRPYFALLDHYWPQIIKFWKNVKSTRRYFTSFYICVP